MRTLELDPKQIGALTEAALAGCTDSDVRVVVNEKYPGSLTDKVTFPNTYKLPELIRTVIAAIQGEQAELAPSFLLRLVEYKWDVETVRRKTVVGMPTLLRPPRGFDTHIVALTEAWAAIRDKIPAHPGRDAIGDAAVFKSLCKARLALLEMVQTLSRLEALKGAHDGLQMLQVLGGWALDPFDATSPAPVIDSLVPMIERAHATLLAFPAELAAPGEQDLVLVNWAGRCDAALQHFRSGDAARIDFAKHILRALLSEALVELDQKMFAASRDFNLRLFCTAFRGPAVDDPALVEARNIAIDLADTLRRRLMEHNLWQSVDARLYTIEQALALPGLALVEDLTVTRWMLADLKALDADVYEEVGPQMNAAMLAHIQDTPERATAAELRDSETVAKMREAFHKLRARARSSFLDVDVTLKRDLARLVELKGPLNQIVERVPRECEFFYDD